MKRIAIIAGGVAVLALTAACSSGASKSATSTSHSTAAPASGTSASNSSGPSAAPSLATVTPVAVSFSNFVPDVMPLITGRDDGVFSSLGLKVTATKLAGAAVIQSLVAGQAQFDVGGVSDAISAAAAGADIQVVGMIDYYDAQLFVTSPNVKTAADLTGKTYAGTSAAGAATLCVKQTMDHFNVTNYQTKLVDSVPNMLAALTNGAVSGYCSQPPASIDLQSKGYNVVWNLTTAKVEAGQVGIITTAAEIKNHPDVVQAFVDSVQKVLNSEKDPANKDKLVAEWAKAIGGNYTTAEWDSTYDYYTQQVTGPDMVPTVGLLSDPQKYLTASVPAAAKLDLNSIIDPTFAEQAKTIK